MENAGYQDHATGVRESFLGVDEAVGGARTPGEVPARGQQHLLARHAATAQHIFRTTSLRTETSRGGGAPGGHYLLAREKRELPCR